jgi:hypothetical protein
MSTYDQPGERYGTAMAKAFEYKHIGWLLVAITLPAVRRRQDGAAKVFSFIQAKNESWPRK